MNSRTQVFFNAYAEDGSFSYYLIPESSHTGYTARAFLIYKDSVSGQEITVYSQRLQSSH